MAYFWILFQNNEFQFNIFERDWRIIFLVFSFYPLHAQNLASSIFLFWYITAKRKKSTPWKLISASKLMEKPSLHLIAGGINSAQIQTIDLNGRTGHGEWVDLRTLMTATASLLKKPKISLASTGTRPTFSLRTFTGLFWSWFDFDRMVKKDLSQLQP